jgi:hypothetical protein
VLGLEPVDGRRDALGLDGRSARAVDVQHDALHVRIAESLLEDRDDVLGRGPFRGADGALDANDAHDVPEWPPAKAGGVQEEQEVQKTEQHRRAEEHGLEQVAPAALGLSFLGGQFSRALEGLALLPHLSEHLEHDRRERGGLAAPRGRDRGLGGGWGGHRALLAGRPVPRTRR